jgi:hypothetical protein
MPIHMTNKTTARGNFSEISKNLFKKSPLLPSAAEEGNLVKIKVAA